MAGCKAFRLLVGLLFVSGSCSASGLSLSQRQNLPAIWIEEKAVTSDYDDYDDVVVAGKPVYYGWGNRWIPRKFGDRVPVEPEEVDDEDLQYVFQEPEVDEEEQGASAVTKKKSLGFMGLDNVDYVSSTLDLHRTLVGSRNNINNNNNNNNNNNINRPPSSGAPDEPRISLATPSRARTNHRPPMTSRFPLSSNVSPSDMRRMMKTLLDAGKKRRR